MLAPHPARDLPAISSRRIEPRDCCTCRYTHASEVWSMESASSSSSRGQGKRAGEHGARERAEHAHAREAEAKEAAKEIHAMEGGAVSGQWAGASAPSQQAGVGTGSTGATFQPDSVTAMDMPGGQPLHAPPGTPQVDPRLDASTSAHSDNALSAAVRALPAAQASNPRTLKELARRVHEQEGRDT